MCIFRNVHSEQRDPYSCVLLQYEIKRSVTRKSTRAYLLQFLPSILFFQMTRIAKTMNDLPYDGRLINDYDKSSI